ncbi:MAG: hypothetical protein EP332_09680 [Bacteroidetes bacterium]|nr:MAG: hypothetical protein EP332_09680 [Bacteroidota bacterium]
MQKKSLAIAIALVLSASMSVKAQYTKQDSSYKKHFIGSTLFLFGNLATDNSPEFGQLNLGYRLTGRDVLSLELITWKYDRPLGINPFLSDAYGDTAENYPGFIREFGIGVAYQRYFWKGLYAAVHVVPMVQRFVDEKGNKVDNGFHIFNTFRVGYHFKLFNDRWFIEPSLGLAGRPVHSRMPDGFKQKDDKWPKYTPEPGLHFGFNF